MTLLADLLRDFRYGARSLARTPSFTVVAVAVLALGIGATSAIFSLVNVVWLKPLPFADEERLVTLWADLSAIGGQPRTEIAPANYTDWQARAQSFEAMTPFHIASFNLTSDGAEPERLSGLRTSPSLFATLGLMPLVGRTFVPEDGTGEPVAVVSEGFWLRRLGGDPAAVGRTITLDGSPHLVVGVVPRDFRFPNGEIDVFVPTVWSPEVVAQETSYWWYLVARLRPGVSLEAARAEMSTISAALRAESSMRGVAATIVPLREMLSQGRGIFGPDTDIGPTVLALLGAVGLVLLIACANVANLILARATARQKELAIRKALGAGRGRVLRQLLAESVLLSAAAVGVGLGIAAVSLGYVSRLLPDTLPASAELALDWRVLVLTSAAALVTVLLCGAGPAFVAARRDGNLVGSRALGRQGKGARRMRAALVVAEIALTVVLLAGAGLLLRSYANVLTVDPGFDAENLLVAQTVLSASRYPRVEDYDAFSRRVLDEVRAIPGVESAGYTNFAPLLFKAGRSVIRVEGRPPPEPSQILQHLATFRSASAGYLETLGVPLLRGRFIDESDVRGAARSVVINETLARRYWRDEDPIGQKISLGGPDMSTVVGVVGDVRQMGLDVPPDAEAFFPIEQSELSILAPGHLVVRTSGDPLALASAVRRAIWAVDPDQPVSDVRTMSQVLDAELANRNTQLMLTGAFAVVALVLAAVGLYGVLSYTVSQSTNEIGLRMALGAEPGTVVGAVVRSATGVAALGIGIGLVAALLLAETIASFLYGVAPTDPVTAAAVAVLLLVVAALAALVPARRAARVDPMTALRAEG